MTKPYFVNHLNEDDLQWKTTSKYQKWNISATAYWRGNLEENSEEISSVALLSPACIQILTILKVLDFLTTLII